MTNPLIGRFPFYYETKIIFIFWLISPYGNGAKILYENFLNQKIEENEEVCIANQIVFHFKMLIFLAENR